MTPLLPDHVARAFLKVILRDGGVSHDLTHITFLSTNIKAAIFPCLGLPRKLSDITSSLEPWWHQSHVGLNGKEQLRLFKVRLCHRDRANVNSWVTGLIAMVGSVVLIVGPRLWARVTEDHHHHYCEGYVEMSSSERWWRSFVKVFEGTQPTPVFELLGRSREFAHCVFFNFKRQRF